MLGREAIEADAFLTRCSRAKFIGDLDWIKATRITTIRPLLMEMDVENHSFCIGLESRLSASVGFKLEATSEADNEVCVLFRIQRSSEFTSPY